MAIVLVYRAAIYVAGRGTASIYTASGAGAGASISLPLGHIAARLAAGDTDEQVALDTSAHVGYTVSVTTFAEPFELRKAQCAFKFQASGTALDDVRVITFHLIKLAGGTPQTDWVEADFTGFESKLFAFWGSIKEHFPGVLALDEVRWYKAGPAIEPPQEPVRVISDQFTVGTGAGSALPPQVSVSVTERTSSNRAWGRFYLPAPHHTVLTAATGRLSTAFITDVADNAEIMYEGLRTANTPVVVYSTAKPERPKQPSGTLPAIGARALTVDKLQVDDIADVIRSRRFQAPLLRIQREIAA